ncbi:peptidase [Gardnerella vaginalis]|uniref:peptidase n=1 Tax=Gardnerella vaginalis TaxID=2702 RepID=UPI00336A6878
MTTKSGKHANKTFGSAKDKSAKVVDMRKVAALSAGAAGVIAGAAIAFGATPAMAAEAATAPVNTNDSAKEQNLVAKKNAEAEDSKKTATDTTKKDDASKVEASKKAEPSNKNSVDTKSVVEAPQQTKVEAPTDSKKSADAKQSVEPKVTAAPITSTESAKENKTGKTESTKGENSKADGKSVDNKDNKSATTDDNKTNVASSATAETPARRTKRAVKENPQTDAATSENQNRASNGDIKEVAFSSQTGEMPNVYGFGTVDNQYDEQLANNPIIFKLPKQQDANGADKAVTRVAVFPSTSNHINTKKTAGSIDFDSDNNGHQPYSGEYVFEKNVDGSATLTMNRIFRKDERGDSKGIKNAQGYSATRSIQINPTPVPGSAKEDAVSDQFRAALLVPPKSAGTIVKKVSDAAITEKDVNNAMDDAKKNGKTTHVNKSGIDGLSLEAQIQALSKVGKRKLDTIDEKIPTSSNEYDQNALTKANSKVGVSIVDTHFVTDLGFKSQAIPLTIVRYNDVIEKPIVEDPNNLSAEVQEEIKTKLAKINGVTADKISFDKGNAVINFDGVDTEDAPKIAVRDLVLKKVAEKDVTVPTGDKAVFVANPLDYSTAELNRIKQSIFEANKTNTELGLTSVDQISLEYLKGNFTKAGQANQGISNGQAENTITVKIKTDKAVAEFTSDIKANKLTKLPNIRTDYDVSWTKTKIDGRDTDEGISWSNDQKTTIIYRYDPTKAEEFNTTKILGLLKATPKNPKSGLRDLQGGELLSYEGTGNTAQKSHMHYALQNGEPTGELTLGNMDGAYWYGNQKVSNSDVDLGDNLSEAGSYTWDEEAGSVTVAAKKGKIFKARLFVEPYAMSYYKDVYLEKNRHPGNTAKAINVIFVPQMNHKTKDLKTSVEEHKTVAVEGNEVPTQHEYYNASDKVKSDYDDALKVAKALYEQVKDTKESDLTEKQKADIDNATIKLDKARKALDGDATKKDKLSASIDANGKAAEGATAEKPGTVTTDRYKNVTEPDFKDASGQPDTKKNEAAKAAKKAYDEALAEANKVKDDKNATQKAVDEAKAKLDAARAKLNDFTTNKEKLNAAIAEHGKVKDGRDNQGTQTLTNADPAYQNATDGERTAYDNAVKKAKDLSADPNASQKDVNAAITALENAKKALDAKATDKSQLITAEKLTFDNPEPDKPNGKKSTFYKNAFDKQTSGANDQEKQAAKTAVDNYNNALDNARKVLKNDKATQAEVDDAKKKLEAAEKVLHEKYASNADELTKVLADNFSGYLMPAYFNAFDKAQAGDTDAKKAFKDYNDAYQKAKELKQKLEEAKNGGTAPDQRLINEAKTALEKARTVIDKYATNTSRLSAAVFNDLAIQNSPAYKNASADDASVEAKAAKTRYDKAVEKLHQALNKQMPKDQANGKDIPDTNTPEKDGNLDDKDYLKNIQAHAQGEPLDKDIDAILKGMNEAVADLNKFAATNTDDLLKSINEHDNTKQTPEYKNASHPDFKNDDGTTADDAKNDAAKRAVDEYGAALNAAKDLLKKPDATQKEVNDALKTLNEKRSALDAYNTDTDKLKESVKKHGSTDGAAPTEGTQTSDAYRNASDPHFMKEDNGKLVPDDTKNNAAAAAKKAYDKALAEAQELLKKADSDSKTPLDAQPTQKEIDAALKDLDDARTEIEKYKTVTTGLETEINKSTAEHAPVTEDDFEYTPEFKNADAKKKDGADGNKVDNDDVKAYKDALAKARKLAQDNTSGTLSDHPTQKQIDEALEALKKAKQNIVDGYKTDVDKLKQAKQYAEDVFKKTPEYKNATAIKDDANNAKHEQAGKDLGDATKQTGFEGQIAKIAEKLKDTNKLTQREVDALVKQLKNYQNTIADSYKTNVTPLSNEVGDKDQDGKPVTPKFEESVAYKNALEKKNAESEEDAKKDDSATKKLEAYNEKLKAAQELINKVNNPDSNADVDKQPTNADVKKALDELQQAKKAIDDAFTTDAKALNTEAAKSTADGGTVADADFEATTEFKNADSKKADGDKDNADVTAYKDALKKARTLLGKFDENGKPKPGEKDIPSQKEVDKALKELQDAKKKITNVYKTDPSKLKSEADADGDFTKTPEYQNAQAKDDDASKQALEAYKTALDDAKKVLGDANATQAQVDDALKKLQDAKSKLSDGYKTNKSDLTVEAGKDSDFTKTPEYQNAQAKGDDASKQALEAYKKALDEANTVLGDKNATQAQVDEALKKLQDAKSKLSDGYKTNKSDLTAEAGKDSDFTKTPEYQNAVGSPEAEAYKQALEDAKKVLGDKNATQAQVDAALKKLQDAKQKLADSHKTDKSDLNTEAGNDPDFRKSIPFIIGKAADVAEYQQALNDADSVIKDPNATQDQVDQALRRLRDAKQKLIDSYNRLINSGSGVGSGSDYDFGTDTDVNTGVGVNDSNTTSVNNVVDKSVLQAEVDQALGDVSANANGVVADSSLVSEFNAALDYARLVLADANATQGQVDSALARLRAARAALRDGMLAARNSAGMNLKRGDVSGVNTGASSSVFAAFAAVFAGLGVAGAASKRRRHSAR